MNIFDYLNLRTEWELIVSRYKIDDDRKQGTIDNMMWFANHGMKGNRFRSKAERAKEIAQLIMDSRLYGSLAHITQQLEE